MLLEHAAEYECEVRRLTGVIETCSSIRLGTATAKDHQVGGPTPALRLAEKPGNVMRANRTLEPVQKKESWRVSRSGQAMHINEIAIRSIPTF